MILYDLWRTWNPAAEPSICAWAIPTYHQPAPAECEAGCRAASERARADALAARLHLLQERNMAADVAFRTTEARRG